MGFHNGGQTLVWQICKKSIFNYSFNDFKDRIFKVLLKVVL